MSRTPRTPLAQETPESKKYATKKRKADSISDEEGDTGEAAYALLEDAMAAATAQAKEEKVHPPGAVLSVVKNGINAGRSYYSIKDGANKFTYFKWADNLDNEPVKRLEQLEDALAKMIVEVSRLRKLVNPDNNTQ